MKLFLMLLILCHSGFALLSSLPSALGDDDVKSFVKALLSGDPTALADKIKKMIKEALDDASDPLTDALKESMPEIPEGKWKDVLQSSDVTDALTESLCKQLKCSKSISEENAVSEATEQQVEVAAIMEESAHGWIRGFIAGAFSSAILVLGASYMLYKPEQNEEVTKRLLL